jgi:acyl-CoA reductase-like NAD-dependent aldehyde dehydrogenase
LGATRRRSADVDRAVRVLTAPKFRNAGQVCVAPTRFTVRESVLRRAAKSIKVGDGLEEGVTMCSVAHASATTMADVGRDVESGMVSINDHGLALPELPFGGVKDSGYGSEGGSEALEAYFNPKLVTQMSELAIWLRPSQAGCNNRAAMMLRCVVGRAMSEEA